MIFFNRQKIEEDLFIERKTSKKLFSIFSRHHPKILCYKYFRENDISHRVSKNFHFLERCLLKKWVRKTQTLFNNINFDSQLCNIVVKLQCLALSGKRCFSFVFIMCTRCFFQQIKDKFVLYWIKLICTLLMLCSHIFHNILIIYRSGQ